MSRRRSNRAGYMLVAVLACLSVVLALTLSALQTALRMRREITKQHLVSQTSLLCEAGLARAAYRRKEADYSGETWRPLLPEIPGKQVEVSIVFLERNSHRSYVQVTAVIDDLSKSQTNRVQRSRTMTFVQEPQTELTQGVDP